MTNYKELERIQEEFEKGYQGNVIKDGIVNSTQFESAKYKILWVLKEANDPNKQSWSLLSFVSSLQSLKEGYPYWKRTFKRVIKSTYAILHGIKEQCQIPSEEVEEVGNILSSVAIINISKVGGLSSSSPEEIARYFEQNKSLLLAQIEAIEPDLVINCSGVDGVKQLLGIENEQKMNKFHFGSSSKCKYIKAYHPSFHFISDEKYLTEMLACVNMLNL